MRWKVHVRFGEERQGNGSTAPCLLLHNRCGQRVRLSVAVMDWFSRKVLSWRVSTSMDTSFCIDAFEEAIDNFGSPEIFNTDQGSQFTSEEFTGVLKDNDIAISMDGKGRWVDNVFVERLWRSVKYEEVYLNAYDTVADAKKRLGKYFERFNIKRRHQGIKGLTPDMLYNQPVVKKAA